nr:RecName: Full=Conotoxin Bu14; Flags: Precursor [Conus bullatus]
AACQLGTAASFARDKQDYPAVRSDGRQDSKDSTLDRIAKRCSEGGDFCSKNSECCDKKCQDEGEGRGVCLIVPQNVILLH